MTTKPHRHIQPSSVAVRGLACIFPGAPDAHAFWQLLAEGKDGTGTVPPDRWEDPEGKWAALCKGGFIQNWDPYAFDASFFGIKESEAMQMDPQHRLLLEMTQHALDDAGITQENSDFTRTGVFVGICGDDYKGAHMFSGNEALINHYSWQATSASAAAGRIAHHFGFRGQALSVDTACSSSLVAAHLAIQALRNGEIDMAVVAGVNLMLSPMTFSYLKKLGALSSDGRCKSFDATADGYARGEGCGVIVLKRTADTRPGKEKIYGLIRGSAVNQDGAGLDFTSPNAVAQKEVLRAALKDAGVKAAQVGYVEAHGTGTPVGDPIEMEVLDAVYGQAGTDSLKVGTVKSNIGHLEGAAGISGLIKLLLSFQENTLPPQLHFNDPNPNIPWEDYSIEVATKRSKWKSTQSEFAAVSGFGLTGTNAHLILEKLPLAFKKEDAAPKEKEEESSLVLTISAKTASALHKQAAAFLHLLQKNVSAPEVCAKAAVTRSHYEHRLVLTANSANELKEKLQSSLNTAAESALSNKASRAPKVAMVFSGQGTLYPAMGEHLYKSFPQFRATVDQCDALLQPLLGESVIDLLCNAENTRWKETALAQPTLFVWQYAMASLWTSWGIQPSLVLGHSVGEIAAACLAGVMSLEDALTLTVVRGQHIQNSAAGKMTSVYASAEEVLCALKEQEVDVELAAYNAPDLCAISGASESIEKAVAVLDQRGFKTKKLDSSRAFHSSLLDALRPEFEIDLEALQFEKPVISWVSSVDGQLKAQAPDVGYWSSQLRQPVRFADALQSVRALDVDVLLEIGPDGTATYLTQRQNQGDWLALPSQRKGKEKEALVNALSSLYLEGASINWGAYYNYAEKPNSAFEIELPPYPFERKRFWMQPFYDGARTSTSVSSSAGVHTLVGEAIRTPHADRIFSKYFKANNPDFLSGHRLFGSTVISGSMYLCMAMEAMQAVAKAQSLTFSEVSFQGLLALSEVQKEVQSILHKTSGSQFDFSVFSKVDDSAEDWSENCTLHVEASENIKAKQLDFSGLILEDATGTDSFYKQLTAQGYAYSGAFKGLEKIWVFKDSTVGVVRNQVLHSSPHILHPGVIDSCLHSLIYHWQQANTLKQDEVVVVKGVEKLTIHGVFTDKLYVVVERVEMTPGHESADLAVYSESGYELMRMEDVRCARVNRRELRKSLGHKQNLIYNAKWVEQELTINSRAGVESTPVVYLESGTTLDLVVKNQLAASRKLVSVAVDAVLDTVNEIYAESGAFPDLIYALPLNYTLLQLQPEKELWQLAKVLQQLKKAALNPQIFVLTRNAVSADQRESQLNLHYAGITGLIRALAVEYPMLQLQHIDLSTFNVEELQQLDQEISNETPVPEPQIALRGKQRLVYKLKNEQREGMQALQLPSSENFRLAHADSGIIDDLSLSSMAKPEVKAGEVIIEVQASGLNFRDLMLVLGRYPLAENEVPSLGWECSGKIISVGTDVAHLMPGDRVLAHSPDCFARYVACDSELVFKIPDSLSYQEAATVPVAFLTAWISLFELAKIEKGETVLIHAGSGGVGIAAIQLALSKGAKVIATAGTPEKRAVVQALGVHLVSDSRSLQFAEDISEAIGKVDVVLNSLADPFIEASLKLLKADGRFVEIGKSGIWSVEKVASIYAQVDYQIFDLTKAIYSSRNLVQQALHEVLDLMERHVLKPLPLRALPVEEAPNAFKSMTQARHVGKMVLNFQDLIRMRRLQAGALNTDASYVVTGAFGALGQVSVKWLVSKGAKHIVLLGRTVKEEVLQTLKAQFDASVNISAFAVDVTDSKRLKMILAQLSKPLAGLIHCAGVLEDAAFEKQTEASFKKAFSAKVEGAWNLHKLSANQDLDLFVIYSSIVSKVGTIGQVNYAAANAAVDQLVQWRRSQGLVATGINWGPWAGEGMVNEVAGRAELLQALGFELIDEKMGKAILDEALLQNGNLLASPANWELYKQKVSEKQRLFFDQLQQIDHGLHEQNQADELISQLRSHPDLSQEIISNYLRNLVQMAMSLDTSQQIAADKDFRDLGLDSLTRVEFLNRINSRLGIKIEQSVFIDCNTADLLAAHIAQREDFLAMLDSVEDASASKSESAQTKLNTHNRSLFKRISMLWRNSGKQEFN